MVLLLTHAALETRAGRTGFASLSKLLLMKSCADELYILDRKLTILKSIIVIL